MRRAAAALALIALAGCRAPESPTARQISSYTIEQFLGSTSYTGASFSPDHRRILVSSDATGIYNAYDVPVSGGEPVQRTFSKINSIFALAYFPGGERFLYSSDEGGDELTHIFVQEPDGSAHDLTPGDGLKARFHGWAPDGEGFFISTNERDPRFFDLYEVSAAGYERTLLFQNEEGYEIGPISPDRRLLALSAVKTTSDSDIFLHNRDSGETRLLTPHDGQVSNTPQAFGADGSALYYTTDAGEEFAYLVRRNLATGDDTVVVKPDWDVMSASISRSGRHLVVRINHDARTEVRLHRLPSMAPLDLPSVPDAEISSMTISDDDGAMAFYVSSSSHPSDLYVQALPSGTPVQLTRSLDPAIRPEDLVEGQVVRFASYDGVEIPGILYQPPTPSRGRGFPALVWVHGGPGGQSRIGYNALIQYLVNHGYAIYAINNRGSSGYGKTFYRMDDRLHGEADLDDCVASREMLAGTGHIDPERIGIIGGSYGGYMVLAALAFRPEAFAVGVDIFGVSNWVRTLESIPPWWGSFREALYQELGDPTIDTERLRRISPLFHAGEIVRPLLVLQGANDPRVLKIESDEIVEAARESGAPVEYIVFDDEGHGFQKKKNRLRGYKAIREFLDEHLARVAPAAAGFGATP